MSALASTLVRLGNGETAEAYARQAVALHNVPGVKDRLFEDRGNAVLNLGTSLVVRRQPEPEEAVRLGIQAIAVPHQQRTETAHAGGGAVPAAGDLAYNSGGQGVRRAAPRVSAARVSCLILGSAPPTPEARPSDGSGAWRVGAPRPWWCRAGPRC
jgi:hypothetical protein